MHVNDDMCYLSVMNIFFMFKMYLKMSKLQEYFFSDI